MSRVFSLRLHAARAQSGSLSFLAGRQIAAHRFVYPEIDAISVPVTLPGFSSYKEFCMRTLFLAASTLALFSVSAAHAGGFAAPVVDVAPVVVTESPAWQGGYVGAAPGLCLRWR